MMHPLVEHSFQYLLCDGYARTLNAHYPGWKKDPNPHIIKLGTWVHPSTGNLLLGGLNLNYLSQDEIQKLRYYLPEILRYKNLKQRYWAGRRLLPQVFKKKYRTYRADLLGKSEPGVMNFLTPAELQKGGDLEGANRLAARREALKNIKIKNSKDLLPPDEEITNGYPAPVPLDYSEPIPDAEEEEGPLDHIPEPEAGEGTPTEITPDDISVEAPSSEPEGGGTPEAPETPETGPENVFKSDMPQEPGTPQETPEEPTEPQEAPPEEPAPEGDGSVFKSSPDSGQAQVGPQLKPKQPINADQTDGRADQYIGILKQNQEKSAKENEGSIPIISPPPGAREAGRPQIPESFRRIFKSYDSQRMV